MKISDLLSHGAENGVGLRHLVHITNLSEREIRAAIQRERLNGAPILSNNRDGYFLPGNEAEVSYCVRSLKHRANEILKTADSIEKAATDNGHRY